jgi:hypothetical protein
MAIGTGAGAVVVVLAVVVVVGGAVVVVVAGAAGGDRSSVPQPASRTSPIARIRWIS